jgi:hypothetical protein
MSQKSHKMVTLDAVDLEIINAQGPTFNFSECVRLYIRTVLAGPEYLDEQILQADNNLKSLKKAREISIKYHKQLRKIKVTVDDLTKPMQHELRESLDILKTPDKREEYGMGRQKRFNNLFGTKLTLGDYYELLDNFKKVLRKEALAIKKKLPAKLAKR